MARKIILDPALIDSQKLYNSEAAAEMLRLSVNSIRYLAWCGKLKPIRIGRRLFFRGEELLRYLGLQK